MQLIIFGLGREGYSSYIFWRKIDTQLGIILVDDQPLENLGPHWKTALLHDVNIGFVQSEFFNSQLDSNTMVMVSPGIKPSHPLMERIQNSNAQISSNTQIFMEICRPELAKLHPFSKFLPTLPSQPKIIGVTGTKGKSTTTSLIYHVLESARLPAFLGGNIGKPALDLIEIMSKSPKLHHPLVVLELSCHQLNRLTISPDIAVIQAITPEHLDYYSSFDDYLLAKTQILTHQTKNDWVIYNADDTSSAQLANKALGEKFCFSLKDTKCEAFVKSGKIYYGDFSVIKTEELQLIGQHNWLNVLPSVILGNKLGLTPFEINKYLKSFSPLPHRLEVITNKGGVIYYNDSLSTTPEASIAAIKSFDVGSIILIAGGFDRGLDYTELAKTIVENQVKWAILLPDTGRRIAKALSALELKQTQIKQVTNLKEAVSWAKKQAQTGDVVLLSPGSASFNHFKDYQERGNAFKRLVL